MKIIALRILKIMLVLIIMFGCSDENLEENPTNILSAESLYKNLNGYESGLNGIYALARELRNSDQNFMPVLTGVDNMCTNYDTDRIWSEWGALNSPAWEDFANIFAWLYEIINSANTIIGRAENPEVNWAGGGSTPAENKNRVLAEAKALRAWAYRYLTFAWGDVPLSLKESAGSSINTDWQRAPLASVRKQIISDLKFAQQYVPTEGSLQGRLTKGAVQHYLAEMYLTIDMPDSALYWADQVINNTAYKLVTSRYGVNASKPGVAFMDMFLEGNQNRSEGNTEALWVMQFQVNVNGGGESMIRRFHGNRYDLLKIGSVMPLQFSFERGGRNKSYLAFTKFALDLYAKNDDRGSNFVIRKFFVLTNDAVINSPSGPDKLPPGYSYGDTIKNDWSKELTSSYSKVPNWPWCRKADGCDPNDVLSDGNFNDQVYLRLADTYLLKAEAQLKTGSPNNAATTINIIRARSHATPVTGANINLDFILNERSRELFLEEERRFTLLRTHKWFERTRLYNKYGGQVISMRDTLFPIPQLVIDANLTTPMEQNPGWN